MGLQLESLWSLSAGSTQDETGLFVPRLAMSDPNLQSNSRLPLQVTHRQLASFDVLLNHSMVNHLLLNLDVVNLYILLIIYILQYNCFILATVLPCVFGTNVYLLLYSYQHLLLASFYIKLIVVSRCYGVYSY